MNNSYIVKTINTKRIEKPCLSQKLGIPMITKPKIINKNKRKLEKNACLTKFLKCPVLTILAMRVLSI
jgi:hypothetical protein